MNATSAVLGIKTIQDAFKVLTVLQMSASLFPQQAVIKDGSSFDFIIAGAGSAGSVIANRLTEVQNATVLLIEAGGDPPLESVLPGLPLYVKDTDVDWQFTSEDDHYTQQFHKNHGAEVTRGKMLGGSSSINFMVYTRGHYKTYDDWAQIVGDSTWNWENLLPYFIKSEKIVDPEILSSPDSAYHGTDGYLEVTKLHNEEFQDYLDAFEELGNKIVLDTNGEHPLGYSDPMVTAADGFRQSTAYSFLTPIKNRPNLHVLKNSMVTKILFDDNRNAIGVEALLDDNSLTRYMANKEVIVSAGAISTPQLLMLSGVGPHTHLRDKGIAIVADLPVGQNLQDHVIVIMNAAMDNLTSSEPSDPRDYPLKFVIGYSTLNASQDWPDYQSISLIQSDSAVLSMCSFSFSYVDEICNQVYDESIGKNTLYTMHVLINPESRGQILLRSSNPTDKPLIYLGYYSNNKDLENHAKYLEDFARFYETSFFNRTGGKFIVPEVCECGSNYDHEFWKCYALCMMVTSYHYTGTCSMGAVVDSRLKVYGIQNLRIADASVMPKVPGANINAAAIMIGEKAADMIKEDNNLL